MRELLAAVARAWEEQGIGRGPHVSPADLDAWEARYGRTLPPEVREYFVALNGFHGGKEGPEDFESITFWNLSELRPLAEERPETGVRDAASCFVFADNFLWGPYALRLRSGHNPGGEVVTVDEPRPGTVATSLGEFLKGYLASDPEMLFPARRIPLLQRFHPARRVCALFARLFIPGGEIPPRLRNQGALNRRLMRFVVRLAREHPHLRRHRRVAVKLRFRVDARGRADSVEVVDPGPIPQIANEAVRMVARMRFAPARVDRWPVAVRVEIPIFFQLPR